MERTIRGLGGDPEPPGLLGFPSDGLFALALTVFAQLNLRFRIDGSHAYGPALAAAVATAVATGAIAWRRLPRC